MWIQFEGSIALLDQMTSCVKDEEYLTDDSSQYM